MKKYIVIYSYSYTKEFVHPPVKGWSTPFTKMETFNSMFIREFDDYREAYDCAQKNNGYVLQTVQPRIIEPEED